MGRDGVGGFYSQEELPGCNISQLLNNSRGPFDFESLERGSVTKAELGAHIVLTAQGTPAGDLAQHLEELDSNNGPEEDLGPNGGAICNSAIALNGDQGIFVAFVRVSG